jgi:hypothetical protein
MYVTMTSFLKQHVLFSVAVEQSTGTIDVMRSELNNLKSITSEGMSKMMRSRSRHEAREGQDNNCRNGEEIGDEECKCKQLDPQDSAMVVLV